MSSNIKLRCLDNNGDDFFVVNSDFGVLSSSTQASLNSTTGSLVFRGGVSIHNTSNAVSNTQGGALTVAGGASFRGDIYVDGFVYSNNAGGSSSTGSLSVSSTQSAINLSTGGLVISGGIAIGSSANSFSVTNGGGLLVAGGAGIGRDVYVGGDMRILGNSNISGTLTAIDLEATNLTTAVLVATTGITTGDLNFTGNLYQNGTIYTSSQWTTTAGNVSYTSGSVVALNVVATNTTLGNITLNNFTAGNLFASSVNLGVASMFSGSFMASNNVVSPSPVTGLTFPNTEIQSFNATVSVAIDNGSTSSSIYTLSGTQSDSGWSLFVDTNGPSGVVFTINSSGQVLYTSTNVSDFVSSTFRYRVEQFTTSGTYSSLSVSTGGSYVMDTIQINNTTDSIPGTSNGGLYVLGGTTIGKSISILSTANASGVGTGGSLTVLGGAAVSKDVLVGGRVGINNSVPSCALDVGGDIFATGNVTSFSDARMKTDIITISDAIDKVKHLRGVYYTPISSNRRSLGVIAQEVRDVLPEAVTDTREDGYLGVAYGNIIGLLIEAIKELSERVDKLEQN
jgi:hypothetical protein